MTGIALLAGVAAGAVIGVAHAIGIYRRCHREPGGRRLRGFARAAYHAAWTLVLWVLFGTYVLYLWLLGVLVFTAAGRPPPPTLQDRAPGQTGP